MKCPTCEGLGIVPHKSELGVVEIGCTGCGGSGEVSQPNRQDTTSPFNDENTKPVPDKPGVWFYHATRLPVHVTRKEDGELYFKGGSEGEEEMKVADFARLKEQDEELCKMGFTQLHMIVDSPITPSNN